MAEFIKLSTVSEFTIVKPIKSYWLRWDDEKKEYERSESYQEGFQQKFQIETDKGIIDFSGSQLGQLFFEGREGLTSDINGKTFEVRTNGKQGKDIRYFLNLRN